MIAANTRKLITLLAVLLGLTFSSSAFAMKIAVVDTQRAVMETEDGLRAQATLKKLFDKRQRELDKKQRDLQKERAQIEKQRSVLSRAAYQKRVAKWQQEMMALQQIFVEYNKELQKKEGQLTRPIFNKVTTLLRRLASSEGFDIIVDKAAVPYHRADLDVTDRVIQLYNTGGTTPSKTTPKAGGKTGKAAPKKAPAGAKRKTATRK